MNEATNSNYRYTVNSARLAFPQLWRAQAGPDGGKPTFSCTLLIPPDHPILAEIKKGCIKLAREKWGDKGDQIIAGLKAQDRLPYHDGATKPGYAGYEGNLFINARSQNRPTVVDRTRSPLTESDGKPYAGCYVTGLIEIWAQDHKQYGKRINASLRGIQFERDGDAFAAGSVAAADEFADLGDTGETGGEDPLL